MCGGSPSPPYISQLIPVVIHQRRFYIGLLIPTGRKIREINKRDHLNIRTEKIYLRNLRRPVMLLITSTLSYPPDMSNNFLSLANMDNGHE